MVTIPQAVGAVATTQKESFKHVVGKVTIPQAVGAVATDTNLAANTTFPFSLQYRKRYELLQPTKSLIAG